MDPRATLTAFDAFLAADGAPVSDLLIVGGAALALLGVIRRPTRDCDVLEPPLDAQLGDRARRFALTQTAAGSRLDPGWLNNGPASLAAVLPAGWRTRTVILLRGQALTVRTLGRGDLLATKLWALCDRSTDLQDCIALAPTGVELAAIRPWLAGQDANPAWPDHVAAVLGDLAQRCGHGL